MSEKLEAQTCTPCRGGVPPLERAEAEALLQETPGWTLADDGGRLERSFTFRNFAQALAFANGVGQIAEAQGPLSRSMLFSRRRRTASLSQTP